MEITYYGHACFGIKSNGISILIDPFISPNPLAKHIDVNSIKADYILISHGHEDHVADAFAIAQKNLVKGELRDNETGKGISGATIFYQQQYVIQLPVAYHFHWQFLWPS